MSVKKSKVDLLHKVRFQNTLPPPPFPPKLLNIPTNPKRYAEPEFTASLANETLLPMVVDAELGMSLDLSFYDCIWNEDVDDKELNPGPNEIPPVDPKDAFMLGDLASLSLMNGHSAGAPSAPQVSWLRKTEYISSVASNRAPTTTHESRRPAEETAVVDISLTAQIRDIKATFDHIDKNSDLASLKHPTKSDITAVESYEILPDADIWANAYDLFRFAERPGDRALDQPDPRPECAIFRPMESDGEHFLAYYLPKEDETAEIFLEQRRSGEEVEETVFSFIRDYETVRVEQEVPNEFLLVLDDGVEDVDVKSSRRRSKGVYYKNIERKILLKKKRANPWDTYSDKWDAINLTFVPFTQEELGEREEITAEVVDPEYLQRRQDADADGEVDEGDAALDIDAVNVHQEVVVNDGDD